jgi:single-strand DNA-binding protein
MSMASAVGTAAAERRRIAMFNEAQVSLTGYVATDPWSTTVGDGIPKLSMRVAWTPRHLDRASGEWVDGNTSYLTVICWRKLADNAATCLRKGDPVVVKGRLEVRGYEDKAGVARTAVEVEASSIGHDLCRGVAKFQRVRPQTGKTADELAGSTSGGDSGAYGPAGTPDGDAAAGNLGLPGAESASGREMFDEDAIAALASDADSVSAPF